VRVHHPGILQLLGEHGARVDKNSGISRLSEPLVMDCIGRAGKRYVLHGRDADRTARFGFGDLNLISSPGQYGWIDLETAERRPARLQDARDAIRLGDALANITIVGPVPILS